MSVNKVILIGNLGKKPELRYTPGGQAVANFTLATNERFGGRDGQPAQERTEWHRIREWQDKEGQKRQTTEIVANTVQFLGGKGGGAGGEGMNAGGEDRMAAGVPSGGMDDFGGDAGATDDDLPF